MAMDDTVSTGPGNADAGRTDSGLTDFGNAAAGRTDSGHTDFGNAAAGRADSGHTDFGQADAGRTDSGDVDFRRAGARHSDVDFGALGWGDRDRRAAELDTQRRYLADHAGITGLEILTPDDVDDAVRIFGRDGFVVIRDALDADQVALLRQAVREVASQIVALDADRAGNRGSHRYSFGASSATRSMLHRPEWQMLVDLPTVTPIISAIFESSDYHLRAASGDFCLPGATEYQRLHSDMGDHVDETVTPFSSFRDPRGLLSVRDLPCPYLAVNFLPDDQTHLNGPTRQIPGTQNSREPIPKPGDEPEWMRLSTVCPAPAGSVQIRDVRAWHGGTPNLSNDLRAIPNLEFYAPWFREPTVPGISYADHQRLSPHARHVTRFNVIDSTEELPTGLSVQPLPKRLTER